MKIFTVILSMAALILLQNCNSSKKATRKTKTYSYAKDIMPIMQARCTPCHFPPEGRKQALNTYADVKANIAEIIIRVKLPQSDNNFMPWKNKKPALSDSLINVLAEWQKQSMPE